MVMGMRSVNPQPIFCGIRPALRVFTGSLPVLFCHIGEQLGSARASASQSLECGGQISLVVPQSGSKRILIVSLNQRSLFDQQPSQPDCAGRFTICQVLDDLACTPLSGK